MSSYSLSFKIGEIVRLNDGTKLKIVAADIRIAFAPANYQEFYLGQHVGKGKYDRWFTYTEVADVRIDGTWYERCDVKVALRRAE